MIGYHAVPVIADAYMKGIRGYDANEALDAMVASANYGPYDGIAQYRELGYVPIDEEGEAVAGGSCRSKRRWSWATDCAWNHRSDEFCCCGVRIGRGGGACARGAAQRDGHEA